MQTIAPDHPSLRRLHRINPTILEEKFALFKLGQTPPPIRLVKFRSPLGIEVYIVADGNHRVQAALELEIPQIPFEWADIQAARSDARWRGVDFDHLAEASHRFSFGNYY